ncbi:aspartyl protease family protein [Planctobacterium marinum]|uniref:Peptidase A2 domain-containing protein n=1 Tax=Planctobacterium marinum TaxID=1631968 RepID=A0AA48KTL7_9ALTE|nr:hypothetical protein MACH26_38330 [Planctobacterium marinum]
MIRTLALALTLSTANYGFASNQNFAGIDVPLSYTERGHAYIYADINEQTNVPMILDTAANAGVLPHAMKETLNLPEQSLRTIQVQGAVGVQPMEIATIKYTGVEQINVANLPYVFKDLPDLPTSSGEIPGILGHGFLSQHCVEFDFQQHQLRLLDTVCSDAQKAGLRESDFFIEQNFVKLKTQFNGQPVDAILDTAATHSYINANLQALVDATTLETEETKGLNAKSIDREKLAPVQFQLGQHTVTDNHMYASDMPVFNALGYQDEPAMLLGINYFKNNKLIIDYKENKIYF